MNIYETLGFVWAIMSAFTAILLTSYVYEMGINMDPHLFLWNILAFVESGIISVLCFKVSEMQRIIQ